MYNTVKLLKDTFGDREFTKEDIAEAIKKAENVYALSTIITYREVVKVVREEDTIYKDFSGRKRVRTNYFYKVDLDCLTREAKNLDDVIKFYEDKIDSLHDKIDDIHKKISEVQDTIDTLVTFKKKFEGE
jgi:chaperonin cofactor prefoldin